MDMFFKPHILIPLILLLIALIFKMKIKDAITSAITLAIAFISVNLVISFMFETINPIAISFVKRTNLQLDIIDLGFAPMLSIAFGFKLALLIFPLQYIVNLIMLKFKMIKVLNLDIFNVWNKMFMFAIVYTMCENVLLAFLISSIQIVLELLISDKIKKTTCELTGLKNITVTHSSIMDIIFLYPISNLLDKIEIIKNNNFSLEHLKSKIGIFSQTSILSFLIGFVFSFVANRDFLFSVEIGLKLATAFVLLPMCASFFIKALEPLTTYFSKILKKKYSNNEIYIGFDWLILSNVEQLWLISIILLPVNILFAIIFAKLNISNVLPLVGLLNMIAVIPSLILAKKNILKTMILSILYTPVFLLCANHFSKYITKLSNMNAKVTYYNFESPIFRLVFAKINIYTIATFLILLLLLRHFMKKYDEK